jgi:hypothetical protein
MGGNHISLNTLLLVVPTCISRASRIEADRQRSGPCAIGAIRPDTYLTPSEIQTDSLWQIGDTAKDDNYLKYPGATGLIAGLSQTWHAVPHIYLLPRKGPGTAPAPKWPLCLKFASLALEFLRRKKLMR